MAQQQMGRYLLERQLGVGGMAEVWLATQLGPTGFRRRCVVKRVLPQLAEDVEFVTMFLDEARLAAQLNHPNIIQILDFGEHEGSYFLAMEHVPGTDLRRILRKRRAVGLPVPCMLAARLVSLLAQALDHAHNAVSSEGVPLKIVHRDVSPHNILLSTSGMVKLIDFGIAKAATARRKTKTGIVKGKYTYMSPEQLRGEPLDGRSDLFALGIIFWEILAGKTAVPRDSTPDIVRIILKGSFEPIEHIRSDLPPAMKTVLDRALQKSPDERYASGAEMSMDLERYLLSSGTLVTPNDLSSLLPDDLEPDITPARPLPPLDEAADEPAPQTKATRHEDQPPGVPTVDNAHPVKQPIVRTVDLQLPQRKKPRKKGMRLGIGAAFVLAIAGAGAAGHFIYGRTPPPPRPALAALPPLAPEAVKPPLPEAPLPPPVPVVTSPKPDEPPDDPAPRPRPHHASKPQPAKAELAVNLTVRSDVPARVSIDGTARGLAPIFVSVPAGDHCVSFKSETLATSHEEKIHLRASEEREVVWHPGRGRLSLWVMPYGEVFLDGKSLGITPIAPVEVWEGRHSLRFANAENGRSVQKEVRINAGDDQTLRVNLEAETPP